MPMLFGASKKLCWVSVSKKYKKYHRIRTVQNSNCAQNTHGFKDGVSGMCCSTFTSKKSPLECSGAGGVRILS